MGAVARITTTGTVERLFEVYFCQPAGLTLGPREDLLVGCSVVFDTAGKAWDEKDTNSAAPQQVILDAKTGAIDRHVRGVGGSDEVWFNSGDGNYYTASRNDPLAPHPGSGAQGAAILGVIDAEDQNLMQEVPTFNVPAVTTGTNQHPAGTAHSVAANAKNNHVFVPLPANNAFPGCLTGCIAVFGRPSDDE